MEVQEDAVQVFYQEISSCRLFYPFLPLYLESSYWLEVKKNIKKDPPQLFCLFPYFLFFLPEFTFFLPFSLYSNINPTQETSWALLVVFPFSCPSPSVPIVSLIFLPFLIPQSGSPSISLKPLPFSARQTSWGWSCSPW